mmetsp:Transcript_17004/g.59498  ORF Transcript_17004/g.59498 Transcript_17004/m.59498 type:complete len:232 (+) Transcript_17004:3261-3956(+)
MATALAHPPRPLPVASSLVTEATTSARMGSPPPPPRRLPGLSQPRAARMRKLAAPRWAAMEAKSVVQAAHQWEAMEAMTAKMLTALPLLSLQLSQEPVEMGEDACAAACCCSGCLQGTVLRNTRCLHSSVASAVAALHHRLASPPHLELATAPSGSSLAALLVHTASLAAAPLATPETLAKSPRMLPTLPPGPQWLRPEPPVPESPLPPLQTMACAAVAAAGPNTKTRDAG